MAANSAGQAAVFLAGKTSRVYLLVRRSDLSATMFDRAGFVLTGRDVDDNSDHPPGRRRLPLETSRTGVFAAGDARSGSTKRVASAAGEGSMAVRLVHEHLAHLPG